MSIVFNKIKNGSIFTPDFDPFIVNNSIDFPPHEKIAVVYAPNGTGKTSLTKVLSDVQGTELEYTYGGTTYQSGSNVFAVINDQNNRNIISGDTHEFFLGSDIRREFELQEQVTKDRAKLVDDIVKALKSDFNISAGNSPLIALIQEEGLHNFIKNCANTKSKCKDYSDDDIASVLRLLSEQVISDYEDEKVNFIKNDLSSKFPIIPKIETLVGTVITPNADVCEIEENNEAIRILNSFHKDQCIVCDGKIADREALLKRKETRKSATLNALSNEAKDAIESVINLVPSNDPFGVKQSLIDAIAAGNDGDITTLLERINLYKEIFAKLLINKLVDLRDHSDLLTHYDELLQLRASNPEITEEDSLYIKEIISNSMNKSLDVIRDTHNRLRICLSNDDFLGKSREELPLSTGEQNFLSLAFEFLKVKNSNLPAVVIDDPISSFDSIYKNKVAYAIIKILHNKDRIILTHNTDLIRLLHAQYKNSFSLYILNNTDGENNGFIKIKGKELDMLVNLHSLLEAFKDDVPDKILDAELFLISMIPFMRGYAHLIFRNDLYEDLTKLMHGYMTGTVDVVNVYSDLFGNQTNLPPNYSISVSDILNKNIYGVDILDPDKYPLLNRTLQHTLTYLSLRLQVEKVLVSKFSVDTTEHKQLGQIIAAAFSNDSDPEHVRARVRLTSKKTLINEFNHFEGNLSIFQPAIDITDDALRREKDDILAFLSELQTT